MIGYNFKITNANGDSVQFANPDSNGTNMYGLQGYPSFDRRIKDNDERTVGRHGSSPFPSYYGSMSISLDGVIVASTKNKTEQMKKDLKKVLRLDGRVDKAEDQFVTITWDDYDGNSWQVGAKLSRSDIRLNRPLKKKLKLNFLIQLTAPDPFIVSQNLNSQSGTRGYKTGNLKLTTKLTTKISTEYQNKISATNNGYEPADTIITLKGEQRDIPNVVPDESDSPNEMYLTNPDVADGKIKTALKLDGNSGYGKVNSSISIDDLFNAGGTLMFTINPETLGENDKGFIFEKGAYRIYLSDLSSRTCKLNFEHDFGGTNGKWITTNRDINIGQDNIVVIDFDSSSDTNDPTIRIGKSDVGITESQAPSGSQVLDSGDDLYVGNRAADDRTFHGYIYEVHMYNQQISNTIADNYADDSLEDFEQRVAYWSFDTLFRGITNPEILNITSGRRMKIETELLGSSEQVIIDSKDGTIQDENGNDLSAFITNDSEFIKIGVGTDELVYLSEESRNLLSPLVTNEQPQASFDVEFRDTQ